MSTFRSTILSDRRAQLALSRYLSSDHASLKGLQHLNTARHLLPTKLNRTCLPYARQCASSLTHKPPQPPENIRIPSATAWEDEEASLSGPRLWRKREQSRSDLLGSNDEPSPEDDIGKISQPRTLSQLPELAAIRPRVNRDTRKTDISWRHPRTSVRSGGLVLPDGVHFSKTDSGPRNDSLRAIFIAYLQLIHFPFGNDLDQPSSMSVLAGISKVFTLERLRCIEEHGYIVEDIVSWAWVITTANGDVAAQRLAKLRPRGIPIFVPLQILQSQYLNPMSVTLLLRDAQLRVPNPSQRRLTRNVSGLIWDLDVAMLLVVRLLRHARRVAPEKFVEIASLACKLLNVGMFSRESRAPSAIQALSFDYNRILSLLSLPSAIHPYRSVQLQQQAQFQILRRMLEFKPNLPVSREGYRGLITTQLAHRKIEEERQWAQVKSTSWPPWREHKLGIDADTKYPGSHSRASKFLARMSEAGYSHGSWEQAAQILAGWDTDKSPTIQSRSLVDRGPTFWESPPLPTPNADRSAESTAETKMWAARVRATRTIREAWACFCSFKSDANGADAYNVYHAMFQKLMAPMGRIEGRSLPGDGKERYSEPLSSQDFLYVPTEPPSTEELYEKMLADGIRPAGRLLADLLDGCKSLKAGMKYIRDSAFSEVKKDVLLAAEKYPPQFLRDELASLPDYLFAAFVRLHVRTPSSEVEVKLYVPSSSSEANRHPERVETQPAAYAFDLLRLSESRYVPAWLAFFDQLRKGLRENKSLRAQAQEAEKSWKRVKTLMWSMKRAAVRPDYGILINVLYVVHETLLCSPSKHTKAVLSLVKYWFEETATGAQIPHATWLDSKWLDSSMELSSVSPPSPAVLQSMVRVLGIAQDVEGIMCLVRWMSHFELELASVRYEEVNGVAVMRSTLLLMRIFLERRWMTSGDGVDTTGTSIATPGQIQEAKELISLQVTGIGWPDNDDLRDFLENSRKWTQRVRRTLLAGRRRDSKIADEGQSQVL